MRQWTERGRGGFEVNEGKLENLLVGLERRLAEAGHPFPIRAMVELTYGCNLRCVHCYNPTHEAKNELTTEQVFRLLDEFEAQGCLRIGFTGGELFTRRDTMEILRRAKARGFLISVLTNATMITPELADLLQAMGSVRMEVSLYGATAETYEKVTQVPGSYARFVRGLDLLLKRRIQVLLKLVMMTLNVHEFEPMRQFALSRSLRYVASTGMHPKVDGNPDPLAYRLSSEQAFDIWRQLSGEKIRQKQNDLEQPDFLEESCGSAGKLFDCACGKASAAVTPYGKMNLCISTQLPQYDWVSGNAVEGWKALRETVASAVPGPDYECQDCRLAARCTRGTMDGWLEQRRLDGPCIPHFKEVAERKEGFLKGRSFTV